MWYILKRRRVAHLLNNCTITWLNLLDSMWFTLSAVKLHLIVAIIKGGLIWIQTTVDGLSQRIQCTLSYTLFPLHFISDTGDSLDGTVFLKLQLVYLGFHMLK